MKFLRLLGASALVGLFIILFETLVCAEDIKIGIILPLTGTLANQGEAEKASFLMAAQGVNLAGGLQGNRIGLIIEDTAGKPEVGFTAFKKLISQHQVIAVTGGVSSAVSWAAAPLAQENQVPFLVSTASADRITEVGWDYVFRLAAPASEHHKALRSFLNEAVRPETAAILYENSYFGQLGSKKFWGLCRNWGIRVVMRLGYNADAYEVKPLLAKLMAKDPDVVFLVSYGMDAAYIVREAKEIGLDPRLFIGGTSVFTRSEFQESAGDASEHIVTPDLWACSVPYPGAMEYCKSYRAKYGRPPDYHGAQAYASIYVIADAVKRAGVLSPIALRDALTQSDTRTVFGPVKFVSHGKKARQNMPPTLLTQWINGRLETIWPRDIASARYILPKAQ